MANEIHKTDIENDNSGIVESLHQLDSDVFAAFGLNSKESPDSCQIIMLCHVLPSFTHLIRKLVNLGFSADNIRIIPKQYSKIDSSVKECEKLGAIVHLMKSKRQIGHYDEFSITQLREILQRIFKKSASSYGSKIKRVILVDDGGFLTRHWYRLNFHNEVFTVSIQQTASGIYISEEALEIPRIDMARSAAKQKFESTIISKGVLRQISEKFSLSGKSIGVAGIGAIGQALVRELRDRFKNAPIHVYDKRPNLLKVKSQDIEFTPCDNAPDLVKQSHIIFGCTGKNWLNTQCVPKVRSEPLLLASCSSREVEFLNLLKTEKGKIITGYEEINLSSFEGISIANAGFPINFDRKKEWERPNEIAITRSLVLASILQALCLRKGAKSRETLCLAPKIQRLIVSLWKDDSATRVSNVVNGVEIFADDLASEIWWQTNSSGTYSESYYK